jgi:CubicO group peptidase (beta-lactamase class C family)
MQALSKLPLNYEPGSTWLYGDSLDVLGYLVESVSKQSFGDFVQQRFLTPLGMSDTHYWPPAAKDNRRAVLVVNGKDDLDSTSRRPLKAAQQATLTPGASGLYSTAADYWRFCQMMLNGGEFNGKRYLGPRTVSWIAEDHLGDAQNFGRPGQTFGLGHAVTTDAGAQGWYYSEGSYFWGGSQGTVFWIDPKEELIGVLMVQTTGTPGLSLREKFAALVYGAIVD